MPFVARAPLPAAPRLPKDPQAASRCLVRCRRQKCPRHITNYRSEDGASRTRDRKCRILCVTVVCRGAGVDESSAIMCPGSGGSGPGEGGGGGIGFLVSPTAPPPP